MLVVCVHQPDGDITAAVVGRRGAPIRDGILAPEPTPPPPAVDTGRGRYVRIRTGEQPWIAQADDSPPRKTFEPRVPTDINDELLACGWLTFPFGSIWLPYLLAVLIRGALRVVLT